MNKKEYELLNNFEQDLINSKHLYTQKDYDVYIDYCAIGKTMCEEDAFDKLVENKLKKGEWNTEHNFRHGINSIKGTIGEAKAQKIWNGHQQTQLQIPPNKTKQMEVDGIDLIVTKPEWRKGYTVQVKVANLGGGVLKLYDSYFGYGNKLDRIIFVDINNDMLVHLGYRQFVKAYKGETEIIVSSLVFAKGMHQWIYTQQ